MVFQNDVSINKVTRAAKEEKPTMESTSDLRTKTNTNDANDERAKIKKNFSTVKIIIGHED